MVIEHGTEPADALYHELRDDARNHGVTDLDALLTGRAQPGTGDGFELHRVGDAVSSRNIHTAVLDSLRLGITMCAPVPAPVSATVRWPDPPASHAAPPAMSKVFTPWTFSRSGTSWTP